VRTLAPPIAPPDVRAPAGCCSSYELSKVGTNLNQIAKAFNILVNDGKGKTPEIGKKLASLRREIKEHTNRVLRVLDAGTVVWEVKQGRGQKPRKGKLKGEIS
jgi:hypothetical protein